MRDRTNDLTSADGGIGCGADPHGGQAPNFSLYLCAAQPALYPRSAPIWTSIACQRARASAS